MLSTPLKKWWPAQSNKTPTKKQKLKTKIPSWRFHHPPRTQRCRKASLQCRLFKKQGQNGAEGGHAGTWRQFPERGNEFGTSLLLPLPHQSREGLGEGQGSFFVSLTHTHARSTSKRKKKKVTKLINVIRVGVALNEVVYYPPISQHW